MSDLFESLSESDVQARIDAAVSVLSRYRFRFTEESDLQKGIAAALQANGIAFHREEALSARDRPDFLLDGGVAIEVKIAGSLSDLLRQVARYLEHDEIRAVLVVGSPGWLNRVPETLQGKPVQSLRLIGSLL